VLHEKLAEKLRRSNNVLFVFYDFETTQDKKNSESATEHEPNLFCLQQFCSQWENESDINVDFQRCVKRKHLFFDDPLVELLTYLCRPRTWCAKVVSVAHNVMTLDIQFILNRVSNSNIHLKYLQRFWRWYACVRIIWRLSTVLHIWRCIYASCPKPSASWQQSLGTLLF
jgi:hypothetical protein